MSRYVREHSKVVGKFCPHPASPKCDKKRSNLGEESDFPPNSCLWHLGGFRGGLRFNQQLFSTPLCSVTQDLSCPFAQILHKSQNLYPANSRTPKPFCVILKGFHSIAYQKVANHENGNDLYCAWNQQRR